MLYHGNKKYLVAEILWRDMLRFTSKEKMKFTLQGTPQSKDRPRFFKTKQGIRSFDPKKGEKQYYQRTLKHLIDQSILSEDSDIASEALDLPSAEFYEVSLTFHLPIPKSDSKRQKNAKLEGSIKHTVKPDIDNLEKFCLDLMSGIAFPDDKQVVKLSSEKLYSDNPRTEIEIKGYFYGKR